MENKTVYVFTNWGLCKGHIVKVRVEDKTGLKQFKVKIDIDKYNLNKDYGFWFTEKQLHKSRVKALFSELIK